MINIENMTITQGRDLNTAADVYLFIERMAVGDICFLTRGHSIFGKLEDVPLVSFLGELLYKYIISEMYGDIAFLLSLHDRDEIATFHLREGSIINISLAANNGISIGVIDLKAPLTKDDIFSTFKFVIEKCLERLPAGLAERVFLDPISREIVNRIKDLR